MDRPAQQARAGTPLPLGAILQMAGTLATVFAEEGLAEQFLPWASRAPREEGPSGR